MQFRDNGYARMIYVDWTTKCCLQCLHAMPLTLVSFAISFVANCLFFLCFAQHESWRQRLTMALQCAVIVFAGAFFGAGYGLLWLLSIPPFAGFPEGTLSN